MLNHYELLYLKEAYPDHRLVYVRFGVHDFVFRTLTLQEYETLISLGEPQMNFEDAVCQLALVYPEDYQFEKCGLAGIPPTLAQNLIDFSALSRAEQVFSIYDLEKQKLNQFDVQCMNLIKAAMPEISYEAMENWAWVKIMKYVVRAEHILSLRGIEGISLVRKDEELHHASEKNTITNKETVSELLASGIDPMFYFKDEATPKRQNVLPAPFLGGRHWQREEVLDAIRSAR